MCNCWTDDIWKAIHIIAKISSITNKEEKQAFVTLLLCINNIISCSLVNRTIIDYMFTNDTDINLSLNSNEQLFKWTILFRQHINKIIYQIMVICHR